MLLWEVRGTSTGSSWRHTGVALDIKNTVSQPHTIRSVNSYYLDALFRKFLPFYFSILLVLIGIGSWHQVEFHEGFNIGDWLINYQGGFVRRGFMGESLYLLSKLTSISPAILLVFLQTSIFGIYFFFSYKLLLQKKDLLKYSILIFSPFLFTFAINSQAGGYRKEILYFAILAFVTYAKNFYHQDKLRKIILWILFLFPIILLTDEVGFVIIPLITAIYLISGPLSSRSTLFLFLLLLENAAIFLLILFQHQATDYQINTILQSLISSGYDPQGAGAIGALKDPLMVNILQVKDGILHGDFLLVYPVVLLFASLAYLPFRQELKKIFSSKSLRIGLTVSSMMLLTLVVIAQDWGRWFYIFFVELFMLILIVDNEQQNDGKTIFLRYSFRRLVFFIFFLICYASFWYIPHVLEAGSSLKNMFHNIPGL